MLIDARRKLRSPKIVIEKQEVEVEKVVEVTKEVPVEKVREFERDYIEFLNAKHRDVMDTLKAGKLTDEVTDTLASVAKELSEKYKG